ncbi:hypothetical protein HK405_012288 [Cladochytrium tenue]|nr:hypothetical protein HK405_012288 [Cladochytrium tenue]
MDDILGLFDSCSPTAQSLVIQRLLSRFHPQHYLLLRLSSVLSPLLKVDFISNCPTEISVRILHYLDAKSLCHAAQVSSTWRRIADDDVIWHRMCEQHIDKKCAKCGWGLPVIRSGRVGGRGAGLQVGGGGGGGGGDGGGEEGTATATAVAEIDEARDRSDSASAHGGDDRGDCTSSTGKKRKRVDDSDDTAAAAAADDGARRCWKRIYAERLVVERNWRRGQHERRDLAGHLGAVLCMQFDECQSLLVTGSADRTIRLWDVDSGRCIGTLHGHGGDVTGVRFDDHKIVSCSADRTVRIWSRRSLESIHVLRGHRDAVLSVHLEDRLLASGSADCSIRVWSVADGRCSVLSGHAAAVHRVTILPRSARLLSCSADGTARLWDLATRACLRVFSGHAAAVRGLHVSLPLARKPLASTESRAAAPRLVTASADGTVRVWDLDRSDCAAVLYGHDCEVRCVAADTLRVVSGSADGRTIVWDLESGARLYSIPAAGPGGLSCCCISDTKLIVGGDDGVCRVFSFAH